MCSQDVLPVDSKVCGGGVVHVQVVDYCATICTVCGDNLLCKKSTTNIIYAILNAIS